MDYHNQFIYMKMTTLAKTIVTFAKSIFQIIYTNKNTVEKKKKSSVNVDNT